MRKQGFRDGASTIVEQHRTQRIFNSIWFCSLADTRQKVRRSPICGMSDPFLAHFIFTFLFYIPSFRVAGKESRQRVRLHKNFWGWPTASIPF